MNLKPYPSFSLIRNDQFSCATADFVARMSDSNFSARRQVYKRLKKGFKQFSNMLNVHLQDAVLREMGIDPMQTDLEEETERGGPYFLPMSQACIDSLDNRPAVDIAFNDEWTDSSWNFYDGDFINLGFRGQMFSCNEENPREAYEASHWRPRRYDWYYPVPKLASILRTNTA